MSDKHLITTKGVIVKFDKTKDSLCSGCHFFKGIAMRNCDIEHMVAELSEDDDHRCVDENGKWVEVKGE